MSYTPNISEEKIRETTCQNFFNDKALAIKILTNYIGDGEPDEMSRIASPKVGKKLKQEKVTEE